jgi:hypothetical protein
MPVDVSISRRKDEDPLEKLTKIASIGISAAGLAQKAGGAKPDSGDAMTRRFDQLKEPELGSSASNVAAKKSYGLGMKY